MQTNWITHMLLVGMLNGTVTLKQFGEDTG